jgi:hypothetical protein
MYAYDKLQAEFNRKVYELQARCPHKDEDIEWNGWHIKKNIGGEWIPFRQCGNCHADVQVKSVKQLLVVR